MSQREISFAPESGVGIPWNAGAATWLRKTTWKVRTRLPGLTKRAFDVLTALVLLLVMGPILVVLVLAIKWDSRGPAFFRQTRVGKDGRHFTLWKFRSMYLDAETRFGEVASADRVSGGVRFKMKDDPRITRVGRILRMTSMDELPQLWNVLLGDMSLVGPRPPVPPEVDLYGGVERRRLEVMPGLTCIWQVSGRSDIPFEQQVEMDLTYVHDQSWTLDLQLLLQTIPAVLTARGAY